MGSSLSRYEVLGDLLVQVVSAGELSAEEMEPILAMHQSNAITRVFSVLLGTVTLSAAVRKRLSETMGDHVAVIITDNAISRGIVTAMSWLGSKMKAFAPDDMERALDVLGLPPGVTEEQVIGVAKRLEREVRAALVGAARA